MDAHDTFLVLTFAGETRVLGMNAGAWGCCGGLRAWAHRGVFGVALAGHPGAAVQSTGRWRAAAGLHATAHLPTKCPRCARCAALRRG